MADTYGSDRKFIEEMTEKYTEVLSSCIKVFIERSDIVLGDGPVIRAVGDQIGWLKIRFDTGERTYLFLFAPSS